MTTDEDVDFYGYAAGIYQQTTDNLESDEEPVGALFNADPSQVHLKFKDENRLSAFFDLGGAGESAEGGARLAFGDWDNHSGRSTVINGDIYAAVESATQPSFAIVENNHHHYTVPADASLYLVSGKLLNPNVAPCNQCDFIKWGTWGGQIQFKDGPGYWADKVTADVNLGWYVAGELTDVTDLAGLTGSATYTGSAIGNVAALQGNIWNTYVATGNVNMNWNFGSRSGDLAITNFDNRSYAAPITQPSLDFNKFSGALSQTGGAAIPNITGGVAGSFVNNSQGSPAAGVIGNFNLHGDAYGAGGVFAGGKQ